MKLDRMTAYTDHGHPELQKWARIEWLTSAIWSLFSSKRSRALNEVQRTESFGSGAVEIHRAMNLAEPVKNYSHDKARELRSQDKRSCGHRGRPD
jgi:hypothetical protein